MTTATQSSSTSEPKVTIAHSAAGSTRSVLDFADGFIDRHIGPSHDEIEAMLQTLGFDSLDALSDATVPSDIRLDRELDIPAPRGESEFLQALKTIAGKNKVYRSCIGMSPH